MRLKWAIRGKQSPAPNRVPASSRERLAPQMGGFLWHWRPWQAFLISGQMGYLFGWLLCLFLLSSAHFPNNELRCWKLTPVTWMLIFLLLKTVGFPETVTLTYLTISNPFYAGPGKNDTPCLFPGYGISTTPPLWIWSLWVPVFL